LVTNTATTRNDRVSEDLLQAAQQVLESDGPGALTVRAIAKRAAASTMAVYSRFGGKASILEALYRRGFDLLQEELEKVPISSSSVHDITELAFAYRRFAVGHPGLYGFMFERPVPGFDPSLEARQGGLAKTFGVLAERVDVFIEESMGGVGNRTLVAYLIWSALHGDISLELTHSVRTPLPGWIVDGAASAEAIYRQVVETVLSGLAIRSHAG
jgi:AcrR family transcriptional regulator